MCDYCYYCLFIAFWVVFVTLFEKFLVAVFRLCSLSLPCMCAGALILVIRFDRSLCRFDRNWQEAEKKTCTKICCIQMIIDKSGFSCAQIERVFLRSININNPFVCILPFRISGGPFFFFFANRTTPPPSSMFILCFAFLSSSTVLWSNINYGIE